VGLPSLVLTDLSPRLGLAGAPSSAGTFRSSSIRSRRSVAPTQMAAGQPVVSTNESTGGRGYRATHPSTAAGSSMRGGYGSAADFDAEFGPTPVGIAARL